MSGLIRPKIELDQAFMPALVTSNFDDDLIKNERASMQKPFSHYKSMGKFLDTQGQLTSLDAQGQIFELVLRFYACPRYLQV